MELSKVEEKELQQQLAKIGQETGGKIVIHIDDYCKGDPYFKAEKLFRDFQLLSNPLQNSFFLYIAIKDRQMALLGDDKINNKLDDQFYEAVLSKLKVHLGKNHLAEGIKQTILELGKAYKNTSVSSS